MAGSGNHEARKYEGWVEGSAQYSSEEPHHARSEFGAWNYVSMHNAARERLLSLIIDGEYEDEKATGKLTAKVGIVEKFPALTDSADDDYSELTAETFLIRENGGSTEHVRIHPDPKCETGFALYSDGWDEIQRDGDEWVATYYSATIEREVC